MILISCPDCNGLGTIFHINQVPYLDSDQPCGRCWGLSEIEYIPATLQSGIEEE